MKKLLISGTKKLAVFVTLFVVCSYGVLIGLEFSGIHVGIVEVESPHSYADTTVDFASAIAVEPVTLFDEQVLAEPEGTSHEAMSEVAFADAAAEPTVDPPDPFAPTPLPTSSEAKAVGAAPPSFEPPVAEPDNQSPVESEPLLDPAFDALPVSPPAPLVSGLEPVAETPATAKELNPPGSKQGTLIPEEILNAAPESFSWHEELSGGADTQPAAALGQLAEIVTDQLQRERISDLMLDLQEKMVSHGPRHPQVISARQYIEYVVRQGMQLWRQQQEREITRLRNRLIEIEQRLSDRASREDELVAAMIESLVTGISSRTPAPDSFIGPAWAGERSGLTPARPHAALKPKSGLEQSSDLSADSSSSVEATDFTEFDAASKQLEQLTVRVTCRYERNKGFPPDEYKFDGVLLADRGLIVSALPDELLTKEARESFELSIVFPVTRTTTDASLVTIDEETGLVVLEPDFFPDDTAGLELNLDEVATGDRIFVATVVDGQFNKEQVAVATATGHARRLVGRPRTISRLATDMQSLPGIGGAPLLAADGRLAGIMSASLPGQYIGAAGIARILETDGGGGAGTEEDANSTLKQTFEPSQPADSAEVTSEGPMRPKVLLDRVLQLHRDISEAKFDIQQAEQKLELYEKLSKANAVPSSELETAKLNASRAQAKLKLLVQHAEAWRTHSTLSDRYAYAALKVAKAEYEMAIEANRKVPNAVSEGEVRKLALGVEKFELELELVAQTLELLKQVESETKPVGAANAAPDTAPSDSAADSVVPSERQSDEAPEEEADSATPAEKTPKENDQFKTPAGGSDPFGPSSLKRT